MGIFVDTGPAYAQGDDRARRHEVSATALEHVIQGPWGRPYVSDYIVDEAFTLTRARTGRLDVARDVVDRFLGRAGHRTVFAVLGVDAETFDRALAVLDRYADHDLSFTDATTVSLMEARGIDHLLSFDDGFDGVVDRLDPAEVAAGAASAGSEA